MAAVFYLGILDYVVIAASLVIAAVIGLKFRISDTRKDYFLAGGDMSQIPVLLSITVTLISAATMMGLPAEVYKYGLQCMIGSFGTIAGVIITSYVIIPVYFQCGVSTVYEFMELRYGKFTRYAISGFFLLQTNFTMAVTLYAPALALSSVTNLSIKVSILLMGVVCTFYCSLGGLKAVLWTDTLQALLMLTCLIAFFGTGIQDAGGVSKIFERGSLGGRLDIFNFAHLLAADGNISVYKGNRIVEYESKMITRFVQYAVLESYFLLGGVLLTIKVGCSKFHLPFTIYIVWPNKRPS